MRPAEVVFGVVGLLVVSGCAEIPVLGSMGTPSEPPAVVVRDQDSTLRLQPWTTCWSGGGNGYCADGMPPSPLPDLGPDSTGVTLEFPIEGWTFEASRSKPGDRHADGVRAELVQIDDRTWLLRPAGVAGRYQVDVFGQGPQGDVFVSFAMTTHTESR